jgi:hypothetical protein
MLAELRDITSLPISRENINLLFKGGFRNVSDLKGIQPFDLAGELNISPQIAFDILSCANKSLERKTDGENLSNFKTLEIHDLKLNRRIKATRS